MDHSNMQTAVKLLAKAQSTNCDAEAFALVDKSYRLLAQVINTADGDLGSGSQPRRERRYRVDRRANRQRAAYAAPVRRGDPIGAYWGMVERSGPRQEGRLDLRG
jgi:hypothetical protein